jgi:hypothetical protein
MESVNIAGNIIILEPPRDAARRIAEAARWNDNGRLVNAGDVGFSPFGNAGLLLFRGEIADTDAFGDLDDDAVGDDEEVVDTDNVEVVDKGWDRLIDDGTVVGSSHGAGGVVRAVTFVKVLEVDGFLDGGTAATDDVEWDAWRTWVGRAEDISRVVWDRFTGAVDVLVVPLGIMVLFGCDVIDGSLIWPCLLPIR